MAVRKQKVPKGRHRSCEKITAQRTTDLAEYGQRAAALAKSKGKPIDHWQIHCPLIGDNNREAWRKGWETEFNK